MTRRYFLVGLSIGQLFGLSSAFELEAQAEEVFGDAAFASDARTRLKRVCVKDDTEVQQLYDACLSQNWLMISSPLPWDIANDKEPQQLWLLQLQLLPSRASTGNIQITDPAVLGDFGLSTDATLQYGSYGTLNFTDLPLLTRTSSLACSAEVLAEVNRLDSASVTSEVTDFCFNGESLYIVVPPGCLERQRNHTRHTWALPSWDLGQIFGSKQSLARINHSVSFKKLLSDSKSSLRDEKRD